VHSPTVPRRETELAARRIASPADHPILQDIDNAQNLVALFLKRADEKGDAPFLGHKADGQWVTQSWRSAAEQVCLLAESLRRIGLEDGDRVALVSENRPEWCIADLAIMAAGCVTVPTYTTNTERDHQHIIDNSGATMTIVSDAKLAKTLLPAILRTAGSAGHVVIGMEELKLSQPGAIDFYDWNALIAAKPPPAAPSKRASRGLGAPPPPASSTPAAPAGPHAA